MIMTLSNGENLKPSTMYELMDIQMCIYMGAGRLSVAMMGRG